MDEGNLYLLSWDMLGLEAVINITDIEKEATWSLLQDKATPKLNHIVNSVMMRAKMNSQRHYEVYTVTMESSITKEDICEMFEAEPQRMAELIRERGRKVYSDRVADTPGVKIV
jgi:hypothetical protein